MICIEKEILAIFGLFVAVALIGMFSLNVSENNQADIDKSIEGMLAKERNSFERQAKSSQGKTSREKSEYSSSSSSRLFEGSKGSEGLSSGDTSSTSSSAQLAPVQQAPRPTRTSSPTPSPTPVPTPSPTPMPYYPPPAGFGQSCGPLSC